MKAANSNERTLIKFAAKGQGGFYDTAKGRVSQYFEKTGLSPNADREMYIKSTAMLALYLVPYFCIIFGIGKISIWLFYAAWILMGFGIVGIGTSIMHDSNHSAYSRNKAVNTIMGAIIDFMGAYSVNGASSIISCIILIPIFLAWTMIFIPEICCGCRHTSHACLATAGSIFTAGSSIA